MSLAFLADVDGRDESRLITVVGALMTGALLLAACEQFRQDGAGESALLAFGCALTCAGWCLCACRRSLARPRLRLQVAADGLLRLGSSESGESVAAVFVRGWSLGGSIFLQVRPVVAADAAVPGADRRQSRAAFGYKDFGSKGFGSEDCRLLLHRRSFDPMRWHALRRWLVWHRRSHRPGVGVAAGKSAAARVSAV